MPHYVELINFESKKSFPTLVHGLSIQDSDSSDSQYPARIGYFMLCKSE